jgi:succinyl-diaminopimelate desuccinylase
LLQRAGFTVSEFEFSPGRTSIVAQQEGTGGPPICLTGHLDTVPLGVAPWSVDPFAGAVQDGKLFGRGASDMKAGVAVIVTAAIARAKASQPGPGTVLVLTAGEETGCEGSRYLSQLGGVLGPVGAIMVAEPSANYPLIGHKGALWLKATTTGVSTHGSMPEKGINAVYKGAELVRKIAAFGFDCGSHEILGSPTVSVGTFHGGSSINVVPDRAEIGIDIRTIPDMSRADLWKQIKKHLGSELSELEIIADLQPVLTDLGTRWVQRIFEIAKRHTGLAVEPRGASYFTDACALQRAYANVPVVILGPGEPGMAHQTDEFCFVNRISEAVDIYREILCEWQSNASGTAA